MEYFLQQLINGLTLGSIYGLIAIGYTMVYGIIGMINFAHGDIFMIGAFIALIIVAWCSPAPLGIACVPWRCSLVLDRRHGLHRGSTAGRSSALPTGRCAAPSGWPR